MVTTGSQSRQIPHALPVIKLAQQQQPIKTRRTRLGPEANQFWSDSHLNVSFSLKPPVVRSVDFCFFMRAANPARQPTPNNLLDKSHIESKINSVNDF
jgi:hypothetical protein